MTTMQKNNNHSQNTQDFITLQDLFYLCLSNWRWFVLSLFLCVGIAVAYILMTEPTYTRTASILIKEDGKGKSTSGNADAFSDLGLFSINTNVNDEMGTLKSPDLARVVISRLHLETTYQIPGKFHKRTVYGKSLPVNVIFTEVGDNESAGCELELKDDGIVSLTDFRKNGEDIKGTVNGKLNDTIQSPIGNITVIPTAVWSDTTRTLLYVSRKSIQSAIAAYTNNLSVDQTDEKSNIITLSFKDVSTQRAEDILNTHIAVYNENWVKDKNQIAVSTSMFINDRLAIIENELGNVDENISSYKSEHLLPDVQATASMYVAQASQAEAVVRELNNQVYMARYIRAYLTGENNKFQLIPANSGIENQGINEQVNNYNQQLLERNSLVAKSSTKNPLVVQMDASLESIRKALLTSIDNELVALETRIRSQKNYGAMATSQIASNPKQAKHLLGEERQQKVKESLYLYLLQKREENELNQAFTAYNTRVITMPGGSMLPTAPVSRNILLVAFALGLLIPLVVIFIMENVNTRVRGRKDLENLTMPFVGEIPLAVKKKKGIIKPKQQEEKYTLVVKPRSRNVINEAFRVLRTNIEFMLNSDSASNVIMLTSANPSSGKTFITYNLAASLAIKGKKVIVIDLDLRKASLSSFLNKPQTGISNYLAGKVKDVREILYQATDASNLTIVPVGTIPPNPTELLFDDRLGQFIATLREEYDYIFIDCPPVEIVADAAIINKLVDTTLFVIRAGLLERGMLQEIQKFYDEKKYKNLCVILNGTDGGSGRYGYKYGYKYGYNYGYNYGSAGYTNNE